MSAAHTFAITPEVMAVLQRCVITEETITLPNEQLARPLYEAVNKVFAAYGGVWRGGKSKFHKFPDGGTRKIQEAIGSGAVKREKVIRQAFYTPDATADLVVDFANISTHNRPKILEPSCGGGSLIRAIRRACPSALVMGMEIDEDAAKECRMNLGGNGAGAAIIHHQDFLAKEAEPYFDFVIMNPPFQRGQAAKHLTHALRCVRPEGTVVCVVPDNFDEEGYNDICAVRTRRLPDGAFKESGTDIDTKILSLTVPA